MLARLLAVSLKHKLAALALMLSVGGGGFVALAAGSSPPAQTPTLQAASAGGSSAANPGTPAAASAPLGPPAGATASSPASATGAIPSSRPASPPGAKVSPLGTRLPAPSRPTTAGAASVAPPSTGMPSLTAPAVTGIPSPSPAVSCPSNQRLTDAEINWLLKQVSKTAAQNPSLGAGAATIAGALEPLLGQDLCAAQAQPVVTTLCSNAGALQTINAMTAQLPFYVKPFVGNPCTDNLATVLPKLSSFSSLLG